MWYIKTQQRTSHLMASFSTFCAAWVAAGLGSPCISAFFLAVIHQRLGSRGDSYRCAGSGSSEASRHLEGMKLFRMQVQFKLTENTVDAPPLQYDFWCGQWVLLVYVTERGYMLSNKREYMLSCLSVLWQGVRANSLSSGLCIFQFSLMFSLWYKQNRPIYSVPAGVSSHWPYIL